MFTGIIEATGTINRVANDGTNRSFWVSSPLGNSLKVDQSLSHSGVCLTVEFLQLTEVNARVLATPVLRWFVLGSGIGVTGGWLTLLALTVFKSR